MKRSGAYELAMAEFPNIARSTLERYWAEYKRTGGAGMAVNNLKGRCGRKTKLTAVLREIYREICIRYSRRWIRLTMDTRGPETTSLLAPSITT